MGRKAGKAVGKWGRLPTAQGSRAHTIRISGPLELPVQMSLHEPHQQPDALRTLMISERLIRPLGFELSNQTLL